MEFTLNGIGKDLLVNDRGVFITEKGTSVYIPYRSIEAIVLKEASALSSGYILFRTPGSFIGSHAAKSTEMEVAMDRQGVLFKKNNYELAVTIRDAIVEKLSL